jgi:hypothetical protein
VALAAALLPLVAFGAFGWLAVAATAVRVGTAVGAAETTGATPGAAGEVGAVIVGAPAGGVVLSEMVVVSLEEIGAACAVGVGTVGADDCTGSVPWGVAAAGAGVVGAAIVGALATAPAPGAAWVPTSASTDIKFAGTAADPAGVVGAVVEFLFGAAVGGT